MKATEILKKAIENGEMSHYQQTGSYAYVAEYEDKELKIVNSALDAEAARPDIDFEIVAEARWYEGQGHPCWIVTDKEADSVEVASADHDGNVVDQDGDIWF